MICDRCDRPPPDLTAVATCWRPPADDVDCVLAPPLPVGPWPEDDDPNPFVRYRNLLWSFTVARRHGMADAAYVELVRSLDAAVAAIDGHGFTVTPAARHAGLWAGGPVLVKDETGNVSGSHKGRHLFGLLLHIAVLEQVGHRPPGGVLAVASCGNAALAAAVVAAAGTRPLRVFVPVWADASILMRMRALGAEVVVCERRPGETGDPAYRRFREAVAHGAVPFGCQGPDNGLTIDGGRTLGYELADAGRGAGLDRVFVQVGGGALATAVADGLAVATRAGVLAAEPRLHAVQTAGCHPLALAHERVLAMREPGEDVDPLVDRAARRRSEIMRPWPDEPTSAATGILDDETYDWQAVVRAMLRTGGSPVVVDEDEIAAAHDLGRRVTGIEVDETGTAGLAGLSSLAARGELAEGERLAVLFTGRTRS